MSKAKLKRKMRRDQRDEDAPSRRTERRFQPEQTRASYLYVGLGMLGSGALGAGVWARFISEQQPPSSLGLPLLAGGAVALAASLWFGDLGVVPVRVGDAGVAIERGTEVVRLAWCDIERVSVQNRKLVIKGVDLTLTLPIDAHRKAASRVLAEVAKRVPDVLDVKPAVVDTLPRPKKRDGELMEVETVQVTGRHCAESDKPITFERDARLCPKCGQVYHRKHVPEACVTCGDALGPNAIQA
jgi:hypothetical protein